MSDTHISDDAFINSIIGEGTRFKGEFDLNGLLRIDGDFTGTIRTKGKVLVGRNGRAECTLHAGTVVIGGVMRGEIFSTEKVIILSTGFMLGNITTPRLIVEEGVVLNGTCKISAPSPEQAKGGNAGKPALQGSGSSTHGRGTPQQAAQGAVQQPAQGASQTAAQGATPQPSPQGAEQQPAQGAAQAGTPQRR
jgi:cytoskeletal protein CcmA (bactofilin family)